jgi:hypothetical protein
VTLEGFRTCQPLRCASSRSGASGALFHSSRARRSAIS